MTPEELEKLKETIQFTHEAALKEMKHWHGSWDAIRELIKVCEENEAESQFERSQNKQ
jgi:hypothetical protein